MLEQKSTLGALSDRLSDLKTSEMAFIPSAGVSLSVRGMGTIGPSGFLSPSSGGKVTLKRQVNSVRRARIMSMSAKDEGEERPKIAAEDFKVPVDAPSGVLLLCSSVLAIASVGCVFELSGGKPTYGPTVTSAILALSLPGFLFLFYAAIRKGQKDALEDP